LGIKNAIDLSIIIPTLGRSIQVESLITSINQLDKSSWTLEIIVVDQNNSSLLDEIIKEFSSKLNIVQAKVDFKGLSRAKNFGAKIAAGKWICFPDDDCEFQYDTVSSVINIIELYNPDVIFGKCVDREGKDSVKSFSKNSKVLTLDNFKDSFIEATTFIKNSVFKKCQFDENMGVGSFFGSEEGYDWLYRMLKMKTFNIFYSPSIIFYHPQVVLDKGALISLKRVYNYRLGTAFLCVKHQFYFKLISRIFICICGAVAYTFLLKKDKATYYLLEVMALLVGAILAKSFLNENKS
jgi:glycosyltransferase involved in cell wall biosynthesis